MTDLRDRPRSLPPLAATLVLLLAGAAGFAVAVLLGLWVTDHVTTTRLWRVESVIAPLVVVAGALAAAWVGVSALVAAACTLARSAGGAWRSGEAAVQRWAPGLVRRALALTLAAGVGLGGAAGAHAAVDAPPPAVGVTADLGWTPTATDVTAENTTAGHTTAGDPTAGDTIDRIREGAAPLPAASPTAAAPSTATPTAPTAPDEVTHVGMSPTSTTLPAAPPLTVAPSDVGAAQPAVVDVPPAADPVAPAPRPLPAGAIEVRTGDTLWALAARTLGPDATDAQIAAEWPRWYAANASTIGPDPDVLQPGQVLVVPAVQDGAR